MKRSLSPLPDLDTKLEKSLRLHFIAGLSNNAHKDLFEGPTAPLGTFSGKICLTHAIGLIGAQSFSDLKLIATIRNRFAHRREVTSFSEPAIAALCSKLQLSDIAFTAEEAPYNPRTRFIKAVVNVMHFIYSKIVAGTELRELPTKSP
jgi:DNA-binding MltR family transcriptional regulator